MPTPNPMPAPELLERMRWRADPLADEVVAAIVGPWPEVPADAGGEQTLRLTAAAWQRLGAVNRLFGHWQDNASLADWRVTDTSIPPDIAARLEDYVRRAQVLPDWVDPAQIDAAERVFLDFGVLSCLLLFCASLPECYVAPDLAAVLHASGQLQEHTDYRIRATAGMIFPVMMPGGLLRGSGSGIAQTLKVRLIHATIRHLILRGAPVPGAAGARVAPLSALRAAPDMQQRLFAHGWDSAARGLPCNQEELAYTLLTFHYVYLRGLRTLGVGLPAPDETAYLHTWNVVGHLLGIERELLPPTLDEAQALFAALQTRARARAAQPDCRPALAAALIDLLRDALPLRVLKPFPLLLTRHLCGPATATDLGLRTRVDWLSQALFRLLLTLVRGIDAVLRRIVPGFALARLLTRLLGERLMERLLLDETRPLQLPRTLREQVRAMQQRWRGPSSNTR